MIESADQSVMLAYVRAVAAGHLAGRPVPDAPACACGVMCGGAFVTLRRSGRLRGCMGQFTPPVSLADVLAPVTVSALGDPRFRDQPVSSAELPELRIEISVLGPRQVVDDWKTLTAGIHGVVIGAGPRSGCLLPQVAGEREWSLEEFLEACCTQKAGLPSGAWRDPHTRIEAFTVERFAEA
jgi:AmmeMemoRadiSam system protein A